MEFSHNPIRWTGWAIHMLGATLLLVVNISPRIVQGYRNSASIVAFCMILVGSTLNLLGGRRERAKESSAVLNTDH